MKKSTAESKSNNDILMYAKQLIREEKATCVIIKNNAVIHSAIGLGVAPLIELYENKPDILKGAFVVDKVIGKAAAVIAVLGGAAKAYGMVMSTAARSYLCKHNIPADCERCVDIISNRTGDGICPLEKTVMNVENAELAYSLLKETIRNIMNAR